MAPLERVTRYTVGTAGHVDHGKSSLVKALTGYDPDVLPEEKERGLTIDLGFTYLNLGEGIGAGLIDVPGHEKFLKTTVAGITGIDAVIFAVAADEGIMPQTREHLAALGYLGCSRGVVALTKADLVDEEWLGLVGEELKGFFAGTFLEGAPVIPTSTKDGRGLDELRAALRKTLTDVPGLPGDGPFRMPIDRVFTLRGFGTLVAGTVASGTVRVKDELVLMPSGKTVRVRGIQTQHTEVGEASAGMRTALNISGAGEDEISRGDEIATPNYLVPTDRLDLRLYLETGYTVKHRERVRFHHGAAEVLGRLLLLETDVAKNPGPYFAQIELAGPVVATRYERFIVRHAANLRLLGGGKILDVYPTRHRRKGWVIEELKALKKAEGDPQALLAALLARKRGPKLTYREDELARELCLPKDLAREVIERAVSAGTVVKIGPEFAAPGQKDRLFKACLDVVETRLAQDPMKESVGRNEVLGALKADVSAEAVTAALDALVARGALEKTAGGYKTPGRSVKLTGEQKALLEEIEREAKKEPVTDLRDLERAYGERPDFKVIMKYALSAGRIIDLAEGMVTHPDTAGRLARELTDYLKEHPEIRVADYKELLGVSRKHATAILDYLYLKGVTVRTKGSHTLPEKLQGY